MSNTLLVAELTVAEVQDRWPQTIAIFREYAAACVGCDLAPFCTLADAAREFQIEVNRLLKDLQAIIEP